MISIIYEVLNEKKVNGGAIATGVGLGAVGTIGAAEGIGTLGQKHFTNKLNKFADQGQKIRGQRGWHAPVFRKDKIWHTQNSRKNAMDRYGLSEKKAKELYPMPSQKKYEILDKQYQEIKGEIGDAKKKADAFENVRPSKIIKNFFKVKEDN